MNVGLIITKLQLGGSEKQLLELCNHLHKHGYKVHILSIMNIIHFDVKKYPFSIESINIRKKYELLSATFRFIKWIKYRQINSLISFTFHAIILSRIAFKLRYVQKNISSIRCINFGSKLREFLIKYTSNWDTKHVFNSYNVRNIFVKNKVCNFNKSKIIYNVLSNIAVTSTSTFHLYHKEANKKNHRIWLSVGRLDSDKNFVNLIHAFTTYVDHTNSNDILYIIGDGSEKEKLQSIIIDSNADNIILLGARHNAVNYINKCDIFTLVSKYESLPNVIIEAGALNKHILTVNVGGISEILNGYDKAILLPKTDQKTIIDGMKHISQRLNQTRDMVDYSHVIKKRFNTCDIMKQWTDII